MTDREFLNLAGEAAQRAYAPYSKFKVGAALECADGSIFTGCNIENSALGGTICAERVAICKAVSEGKTKFRRIAIWGEGESYCMPCGACRQFLAEFDDGSMEVLCSKAGGRYVSYNLSKLLPYAFSL